MNFKKILASVAASAVAVSAMSVAAFAANLTINGTFAGVVTAAENWQFDLNVEGVMDGLNVADIYGATIVFTQDTIDASATTGVGGAFIFSTKGKNWNAIEWGNADAGKPITLDTATRSITRMETEPFFNETDVSGADGEYAQVCLQCWWGPDSGSIEVESISLLGKDGAALKTFDASTDLSGGAADTAEPAGTDYTVDLGGKTYAGFTNLGYITEGATCEAVINSLTINGYTFTDPILNIGKVLTGASDDNCLVHIWSGIENGTKVYDTENKAYLEFSATAITLYVDGAATDIESVVYNVTSTGDETYKLQFSDWTEATFAIAKNADEISASETEASETEASETEASEEETSAPEETAAPEETTSEETAAPEETTAAAGDTDAPTANDKGAADTGVEGVAVVAGLAVIAAGAVIIAKKRG